jgi:iron-sulfur cluster assembly protein/iron-sulfur cluster insertion protein
MNASGAEHETTVLATQEPTAPISVSDEAIAKLTGLLEAEGDGDLGLRIAVRPGGCSGFSYEMFFDAETGPDDLVVTGGAVRVMVDQASATMLNGARLNYTEGLQGAGFSIENPNAQRSCGCGQSFS